MQFSVTCIKNGISLHFPLMLVFSTHLVAGNKCDALVNILALASSGAALNGSSVELEVLVDLIGSQALGYWLIKIREFGDIFHALH